jgi:ABC-2 type transport system ATP-binding protein
MSVTENTRVLVAREIRKTFRSGTGETVHALEGVSLTVGAGVLTALVGPDGAGKTTLIRLAAGLVTADSGEVKVLGTDVAADPQQVQERIGYMPQKFGLYEDLSVQENLELYADLHGVTLEERRQRYPRLMEMTALGPFMDRLAGRLSGGMKQKLGLACTLIRSPELLLLDEPTVGVDPLSRRELWEIILQLVNNEGLTVLLGTTYLDEAERCGHVIVLHEGKILAEGPPKEVRALAENRTFITEPPAGQRARTLQARLLDDPSIIDAVPEGGKVRFVTSVHPSSLIPQPSVMPPRFEDGFMVLLRRTTEREKRDKQNWRQGDTQTDKETRQGAWSREHGVADPNRQGEINKKIRRQGDRQTTDSEVRIQGDKDTTDSESEPVVQVDDLVRRFGDFTAVDHISFEVRHGEIFGLLGPNGAGKTTTFRMLCGLLPATSGTLRVAGVDLRSARASARQRIGYVAQKFSLYGQLSVSENLEFFASAYGLRDPRRRERIDWALREFDLTASTGMTSDHLPGGYKQRLAMAAALLHEPEILFLDEPTSGVDPLARREFWRRITALAEQGVTVIITTHFMEEAEYCDRVVILDAGRVLAQGTPADVRSRGRAEPGRAPTMEDAFIAIVEDARARGAARQTTTEV